MEPSDEGFEQPVMEAAAASAESSGEGLHSHIRGGGEALARSPRDIKCFLLVPTLLTPPI